ncbi:hypothetical protein [Bacterioplanoides sp.]|uniref:hypothetical protein n=1 Tax=Bacterioplanoides sp. TaxID=2066072 RepID=UPI003AFFF1D0
MGILHKHLVAETTMQQHKETQEKSLFFQIGTEKLIELSLASFGLYGLYWNYQNWLQIERQNGNVNPLLRTVLSLFFQYDLFRRVYQQSEQDGEKPRWSPARVYLLYVLFNLIPVWLLLTDHPWGGLVFMLTLLPNLLVNQTINLIHDKRLRFFAQNTDLSGTDWGVITVGFVVWLSMMVMAVMA